jgi:hypothetical protein
VRRRAMTGSRPGPVPTRGTCHSRGRCHRARPALAARPRRPPTGGADLIIHMSWVTACCLPPVSARPGWPMLPCTELVIQCRSLGNHSSPKGGAYSAFRVPGSTWGLAPELTVRNRHPAARSAGLCERTRPDEPLCELRRRGVAGRGAGSGRGGPYRNRGLRCGPRQGRAAPPPCVRAHRPAAAPPAPTVTTGRSR